MVCRGFLRGLEVVSLDAFKLERVHRIFNCFSRFSRQVKCEIAYEGWAQLAKQPDEEGSSRGLTLSLLLDLCLLLHPEQLARVEHKLPAYTVGSLQRRTQMEVLLAYVQQLLQETNPAEKLTQLSELVQEVFQLRPSGKHMSGRELGRLEPTPSLRYRAIA